MGAPVQLQSRADKEGGRGAGGGGFPGCGGQPGLRRPRKGGMAAGVVGAVPHARLPPEASGAADTSVSTSPRSSALGAEGRGRLRPAFALLSTAVAGQGQLTLQSNLRRAVGVEEGTQVDGRDERPACAGGCWADRQTARVRRSGTKSGRAQAQPRA